MAAVALLLVPSAVSAKDKLSENPSVEKRKSVKVKKKPKKSLKKSPRPSGAGLSARELNSADSLYSTSIAPVHPGFVGGNRPLSGSHESADSLDEGVTYQMPDTSFEGSSR